MTLPCYAKMILYKKKSGIIYKEIKSRNSLDVFYIKNEEMENILPFGVTVEEFHRMFQTENKEIFEDLPSEDIPSVTERVAAILSETGSLYALHFQDLENTYETPPIFKQNNSGDQIWHFAYSRPDEFGGTRDYMLMLVINCRSNSEQPVTTIKPLAILTGEQTPSGMFEPLEQIVYIAAGCKAQHKQFRHPSAYVRLACMIEASLEFIMLDEELDDISLSEWFSMGLEEVLENYQYLVARTTSGLYRHIQEISGQRDQVYSVRYHPLPPIVQ
jgi:hypothetical protein